MVVPAHMDTVYGVSCLELVSVELPLVMALLRLLHGLDLLATTHTPTQLLQTQGLGFRVSVLLWQCLKLYINPLHAKFFRGKKNVFLHYVSLLHIDIIQVVEILPYVRH